MVRSVALGFGVVTALALAGSMTPKGQAMLGLSHPAAEQATPVTVIQDKSAPIPAPVQSVAPVPTGPAPHLGASRPVPGAPQPQARPVGPVVQRPSAGPALQQQGGPGGLAGVVNILLNLPQVLDQSLGGPARGSDSKPVRFHKKPASGDDHGKDSGESNH
jgi:hypothetical protein